jgi:hypothetical protein
LPDAARVAAMARPGVARLGTPARGHGARPARFAAAPDSPSARARPGSASRPSPRGCGFGVSPWLGVPSWPRRGGAAHPPLARPAPGLGTTARARLPFPARPPATPAWLGHGGRSSAMASGATPGVPRSPPLAAWLRRGRSSRGARLWRATPPWLARSSPSRPRHGWWRGAVAPPRLRRGAQPRPARRPARTARPRGLPAVAPGVVCSRGSPAWLARGSARRGLLAWLTRDVAVWSAPWCPSSPAAAHAACFWRPTRRVAAHPRRVRSSGPRPRSLARVACSSVHAARPRVAARRAQRGSLLEPQHGVARG